MKPINEMNLEELAEYAVTLDGWDWMPGMMDADGGIAVSNGKWDWIYICDRMDDDSAKATVAIGQVASYERPDLTDPATLGCVLAMVRKKHGEWAYTLPTGRGWRVLIGNPEERSVSVVSAKEEMPTEAHALIAALAKEAL